MIPPWLVTKVGSLLTPIMAKLSSPLVKWGLVAGVLVLSNLWTWHRTTVECEREKVYAIAEQAAAFSKQHTAVIESREGVLRQRNEIERVTQQKIVDLQKRLVIYERNAKHTNTPVPPDSIGMFNAISGLLPAQNAVPVPDASSRKSDEPSEARIETTRLLLAYVAAYADCGGQLSSLWDDYDALRTLLRKEYAMTKDTE